MKKIFFTTVFAKFYKTTLKLICSLFSGFHNLTTDIYYGLIF